MRALFEFKCEEGHISELFVDADTRESTCEYCDNPSSRIISAVRCSLDPISGDFIGATDRWAKNRQKQKQLEQKAVDNHGPDAAWDVANR